MLASSHGEVYINPMVNYELLDIGSIPTYAITRASYYRQERELESRDSDSNRYAYEQAMGTLALRATDGAIPTPVDDWRMKANCRYGDISTDTFFQIDNIDAVKEAKEKCGTCEVKVECRTYAIENREKYGVWGGLTPRERQRIIRKRRK